jgi:hypothetical protein
MSLWNGQGGDGLGGAQHFMEEAGRETTDLLARYQTFMGLRDHRCPCVLHDHALWPQAYSRRGWTRTGRD